MRQRLHGRDGPLCERRRDQEPRAGHADEGQGQRGQHALAQGRRKPLAGAFRRAAQRLAEPLGQQQHRDGRQHHLVAGLVQGQVQEAQHRGQPEQRDLHAAVEEYEQRGHQRQLEGGQVAEVGALPFHDVLQPRHGHQLDRIDQAGRPVRGDHRRAHGGQAEQPPAADDLQPVGVRLDQRLGGEGRQQRQAEQEAAVQIGPEHHHRQQPHGRRPAPLARMHQLHGPERQKRQDQEVRPGEPALGGAGQGEHQRAGPAQRLQPA